MDLITNLKNISWFICALKMDYQFSFSKLGESAQL